MSMDSPNKNLEETMDLQEFQEFQEDDGSNSIKKLDLNLAASKEGIDGYNREHKASVDKIRMDLNEQDAHGSYPLQDEDRFESGSHLDYGEEKRENHYNRDKRHSHQGKTEMASESLGNFSSPVEAGAFQSEMEGGDLAHCSGTFSSAEDFSLAPKDSLPSHNDKLKDSSDKISGNLQKEPEYVYEEMADGGIDHLKGRQYDANETKDESTYYSQKSPLSNENLERRNSDSRSPGRTPKRSASPLRQMSVSPQRSPCIQKPVGQELSSPQGDQNMSHSPLTRHKRSPSPRRSSEDNERVHSPEKLSVRRTSTSPERRPQHHSSQKDESNLKRLSASPRRHHSPSGRRRRDRLASRSPTRRNDSSVGHRRDYRDRSRSRSPYGRDRYRRSPRRRYSPRQRSPPSRYHSRRHSPRRRPWSPPPNRSTGLGRPGKNLFIAGFSFVTTERDLEKKFSRFGRVRDVRIVRDKRSGDSRGFGFLSLERDEDADAAIRALDQTEWNGRVVLVEKSKAPAH